MADGARATAGLPSSNRGVSEFRNEQGTLTVGIDWLSASVDLFGALRETGFLDRDGQDEVRQWIDASADNARIAALQIFCWFFAGLGLELDETATGQPTEVEIDFLLLFTQQLKRARQHQPRLHRSQDDRSNQKTVEP